MTRKFYIPNYLDKGNKAYMTNDKKVIDKLIEKDYIIVYDKKIYNEGDELLLIPIDTTITIAYRIMEYIELNYEEKFAYKVANILEIGCFDSDINWIEKIN